MSSTRGWDLEGPFDLDLRFYFQDLKLRDDDNCEKAVKDALKGVVWDDDKWVRFRRITKAMALDRKSPRVEIEVSQTVDETKKKS